MAKSADAFRTISEVADWLETPAHVLRFWESKFSQVKPVKRAGGRRYYRPTDMKLLGGIKQLLHEDGLTIKGVQKILREQGVKHVAALSQPLDEVTEAEADEVTLEVVEDAPAETAEVLSFRKDTKAPVAGADAETDAKEKAKAAADAEAKAAAEAKADAEAKAAAEAKAQAEADAAAAAQAEADAKAADAENEAEPEPEADDVPDEGPSTAPAMPSFLQRRPEASSSGETAEKQDDPAPEAPAPKISLSVPRLPDDPADDIAAEPGPLSALCKLTTPVSPEALAHLNELAAQLWPGDPRSDS